MIDRRGFLKIGGTALAAGVLLGSEALGQKSGDLPSDIYTDRVSSFTATTFEPAVGSKFSVVAGEDRYLLRLTEVERLDYRPKMKQAVATSGFVLVFEAVSKGRIADGTYEVTHPDLGAFTMSVSTLGMSGREYQAVFNRVYA